MSPDNMAYLFYLIVLGLFIGGYFLFDRRQKFSKTVQQALIWLFIFVLAITAYGFRDTFLMGLFPREARQIDGETIALSRDESGSFLTELDINGQTITFLVDTGASQVVLSQEDAVRVGFDPEALTYSGRAATANGIVETAPVLLDLVEFGAFADRDVAASVNAGALEISLLGMSYLDRFDRIEIRGNSMILVRR